MPRYQEWFTTIAAAKKAFSADPTKVKKLYDFGNQLRHPFIAHELITITGPAHLNSKIRHLSEELVGRYSTNRAPIGGFALPEPSHLAPRLLANEWRIVFPDKMEDEVTLYHGSLSNPVVSTPSIVPLLENGSAENISAMEGPLLSLLIHLFCEFGEPNGVASAEALDDLITSSANVDLKCAASVELRNCYVDLEEVLKQHVADGGLVFTIGNGGSACDAEDFVAMSRANPEYGGQFIPFLDGSAITCMANDWDFSQIFARQVRTLHSAIPASRLLVAISTSGDSPNVLRATEVALHSDIKVIFLGGKTGGEMKSLVPHYFIAPSETTNLIQEVHASLLTLLSSALLQLREQN